MANNLSVKIGANTADLEKNVERAKRTLEKYRDSALKAKNNIEKNVSVTNQQVNAYQRVVKQLEKVNSGTLSTTQQQKVLTNQVKELKIQWNALTDDQKISDWGQQIANSLKAAESELETTKQKLAEVSDQTEKTSQSNDKMSGSTSLLESSLSKYASVAVIAKVATEAFERVMTSTQTSADFLESSMSGLNTVIDSFCQSLLTADFTNFNNGLLDMYERGKAAAESLDDLGNVQEAYNYVSQSTAAALANMREVLSNDKSTQEERAAAIREANKALDEQKVATQTLTNQTVEAFNDALKKGNSRIRIQQDELHKVAGAYALMDKTVINVIRRWGDNEQIMTKLGKKYNLTIDQIRAIKIAYENMGDEQRQFWINQVGNIENANRALDRYQKMLNTTENKENGNNDKPTKTPAYRAPKVKDKTLIQQLEETNKKLQEEYDYRVKNYNKLSELVQKQKELNDQIAKQKELELLNTKALDKKTLAQASGAKVVKSTSEGIKDVDKDIKNFSKDLGKKLEPQIKNISRGWKEAQKDTMTQQEAIKSLGQSASIMGEAFSTAFGEASGAAKAFIAIERVMLVAEQAVATAAAIKKAVESSKHWIEAIAASAALVGQVVSLFSTISKFEGGGIVNSASKTGDRNIIRVNGDEMILNQRQQGHLFKMLDDPYVSHAPNISYMQPDVKIKGSDIYLSQKNFKSITGKSL